MCISELYPENEDAIRIWQLTSGQVISVGMGGVVDINHLAVWRNIDELGIANRTDCFFKVLTLFHHFLELQKLVAAEDTKP